jgi:hypothetical protein
MRSLKSLIMMNLKFRHQSKCSFREEKHDARIEFSMKGTYVPCDLTVKFWFTNTGKYEIDCSLSLIMIMKNY